MHRDRLQPGARLGAFEIVECIADGGMGSVYKGRNRISGELRALKVILPQYASNQEFVGRFIRELKIAASIEHPNLVKVLEPAMDGDTMFLPMELLQGETLSARIRRVKKFTVDDALRVMIPVCHAIGLMHSKGIIHRDLKPANIFLALAPDGKEIPKVLDFGAARPMDVTPDDDKTQAGVVIGSALYMAPEQATGTRDLDARVDQYALGVMLYQLLTGFRPFEGDATGAMMKLLQGAPIRRPTELAPEIPLNVEQVLMRALARNRDQRFPNLEAFAAALEASHKPQGDDGNDWDEATVVGDGKEVKSWIAATTGSQRTGQSFSQSGMQAAVHQTGNASFGGQTGTGQTGPHGQNASLSSSGQFQARNPSMRPGTPVSLPAAQGNGFPPNGSVSGRGIPGVNPALNPAQGMNGQGGYTGPNGQGVFASSPGMPAPHLATSASYAAPNVATRQMTVPPGMVGAYRETNSTTLTKSSTEIPAPSQTPSSSGRGLVVVVVVVVVVAGLAVGGWFLRSMYLATPVPHGPAAAPRSLPSQNETNVVPLVVPNLANPSTLPTNNIGNPIANSGQTELPNNPNIQVIPQPHTTTIAPLVVDAGAQTNSQSSLTTPDAGLGSTSGSATPETTENSNTRPSNRRPGVRVRRPPNPPVARPGSARQRID